MQENEKLDPELTDVDEQDLKDLETLDGASEEAEEAAAEAEEVIVEEPVEEEAPAKKGLFGKKKDKKTAELEEKLEQLTDRYTRLMAEFDNYRKRTEKEKAAMRDNGVISTVEKMLPVVDNFERGLASVPEEDRENSVYTGMDQIYKQMVKVMTDMGVEPMNAEGENFDPNLHNAVLQVPSEDESQSGKVSRELQKGYTYKGNVVRHAMVAVFE